MPKIAIELGKPIEGVLKWGKGKAFESKFPGRGGSMMYSLASGDCIFLDEDVCQDPDGMFHNAGIGPNDTFRLCLRKTRGGAKYYEVVKLGDAAEPTGAFESLPSEFERDLAASIEQAKARRAQSPAKASPAAPSQPVQQDGQQSQDIPVSPGQTILSQLMAGCMVAAIDAAAIGRDYAHEKGLALSFDQGSIERIAVALLIRTEKMVGLEREAAVIAARVNGGAQSCLQ